MLGIDKKLVLDGSRGVFWPPRCLFWRKLAKISKFLKFVFPAGSSLYAAGNDVGPIFSCSPDPGDAFCTVARLHNSFSDDSRGFEKNPSENDCKIGDDRNS